MIDLLCTIVGIGERTSLEKVGVGRRLPVDALPRLFGLRDDDFVLFESRRVPRSSVEHGLEAAERVDDGLIVDADRGEFVEGFGYRVVVGGDSAVVRTDKRRVVNIKGRREATEEFEERVHSIVKLAFVRHSRLIDQVTTAETEYRFAGGTVVGQIERYPKGLFAVANGEFPVFLIESPRRSLGFFVDVESGSFAGRKRCIDDTVRRSGRVKGNDISPYLHEYRL